MNVRSKIYIYLSCATIAIGIGMAILHVRDVQDKKRDLNSKVTIKFMRNSPQDIVTLNMPEGYIDRGIKIFNAGGVNGLLFLRAEGSELRPESIQNQVLFSFPRNLYNVVHIQISSVHDLRPDQFDERTQDFLKSRTESLARPCEWSKQTDVIYGLHHEKVDLASCPEMPLYANGKWDLYEYRDARSHLMTVVRCTPAEWKSPDIRKIDGMRPMPGAFCEHEFAIKKFNSWIILQYPRDFLPDWQNMENKIDDLLSSALDKH